MKTKEEIQAMFDVTINKLLGQHRGRVDVVNIHQDPDYGFRVLFVKMSGGCQGCAGARATLASIITNSVKQFDPTISSVLDSTDHDAGKDPFFKE